MWPLPTIPSPYVWAALFLAGVATGGYGTHTWYKAQRVEKIEAARSAEHDFQRFANQGDVRYVDRLHEQAAAAEQNERDYRRALLALNSQLDACRVDADLLRVLDGHGLPAPAGDPGEPGPPAPRPAPSPHDSTAAHELDTCRRNYREVCEPNAVQLDELQRFTRGLIRKYNRAIGAE